MLFFHRQHFVMPFSLRMYYFLVSSLLGPPSMSSIADSGNLILAAACFKCGYFPSVLYPWSSPFFANTRLSMSHSFLPLRSFHSQRNIFLHHHDTPLSLTATLFSGFIALHPHLPLNPDNENTTVSLFFRLVLPSSWHLVTDDICCVRLRSE